ncbi:MAG: hypothetical protein JXA20_12000 [Spirochaetes bacterium]|nr:hypothetical protein [Spirochaetota bacterium]
MRKQRRYAMVSGNNRGAIHPERAQPYKTHHRRPEGAGIRTGARSAATTATERP